MAYLYKITNTINSKYYIGITKTSIRQRWNSHKFYAKTRNGYLYNAMRKYGYDVFVVEILVEGSWRYVQELERSYIATYNPEYNIAPGGEGGFTIVDVDTWKRKLSATRIAQGNKPFLGKTHTEETKNKCREAAKARWATQQARINAPCRT